MIKDKTLLINKLKYISEELYKDFNIFYIQKEDLLSNLRILRDDFSFLLLLDITAIDYLKYNTSKKSRFSLIYILRNYVKNELIALKIDLGKNLELDTSTSLFKSANWLEREAYDQYGVIFKGHKNLKRILNHHHFVGHPLRKDYDITKYQVCKDTDDLMDEMGEKLIDKEYISTKDLPFSETKNEELKTNLMFLNVGPAHPASHGTIRNLVALDGEKIVAAVSEIGYLHRGFEKSAENHTYNQIIPYTDRLNYCSAIINNVAFSKVVEAMLEIKLPDRAIFMRVILMELSRIIDHLVCIAALCVDSGGLTNFWYLYNKREDVYSFLSKLTGARLTNSFTRIGGMARDFYRGWENELNALLKGIQEGINDGLSLIASNKIFLDRVQDVCIVNKQDAISYGFTGPNLRASGVDFDLRKDNPYYYYDSFDFCVPIGSVGDIYDRVMVRFEEIKQSINIIKQAMKIIPNGPVNCEDKSVVLPAKKDVYNNIEGLMNHFKLVFEGVKVPAMEFYDSLEAANGELGFFIVSNGEGTPYKVKVRPPCFFNMASYANTIENHMLSDAILHLGSINIIAGELDR